MQLESWQIWHTYSTYVQSDQFDLKKLARILVEEEVACLAMHQDGTTYFTNSEVPRQAETVGSTSPDGDEASFSLSVPLRELTKFQQECWGQGCGLMLYESKVFGTDNAIPHEYLRAFIGEVEFYSEARKDMLTTYPIVTIYATGVIIIELRLLSPERVISHTEFVNEHVNVFKKDYDRLLVPPAIAYFAPLASHYFLHQQSVVKRFREVRASRQHGVLLKINTVARLSGDFAFEYAPLANHEGSKEYLEGVGSAIVDVVAYMIGRRRNELSYLLFGANKAVSVGNPWTSRPHIHIQKYDNQAVSADVNAVNHADALQSIYARIAGDSFKHVLPSSARLSDDFLCYVGSHLSLRVWSSKDWLKSRKKRLEVILEEQAINNLLDYVYMLHLKLYHQARVPDFDRQFTWALQRQLVNLEQEVSNCARAGEIRSLYTQSWLALGIEDIKQRTQALLAIENHETEQHQTKRNELIGRILIVMFGLSTLTPLVKMILIDSQVLSQFASSDEIDRVAGYMSWPITLILVLVMMLLMSPIINRSQLNRKS